ncbi:hypothetical protein [Natronococcus wangiae]|uniref:hypothetical protein n=1 Tax=Natronococcus wangiae TaxID=3068275 RepID=UPI00273DDACB|nr:hypothetical protein [Natronococcus sp. AD5]
MAMETYRLEVRESDASGIDADVYGADDLIEESTRISYEDFDLDVPEEREESPVESREITADVTTIDLQVQRDDGGFTVRLLGDRDELTAVRIDDEEWNLG